VLDIESSCAIIAAALIKLLIIVGVSATLPATPTRISRYYATGIGDLHQNHSKSDERNADASPVSTPTPAAQDAFLRLVRDKLSSMPTNVFGPIVGPAMIFLAYCAWLLWRSRKDLKDAERVAHRIRRWVLQKVGRSPPENAETLLAGAPTIGETDDRVGLRSLRERVKHAWIHGVLEESFSSRPRIELDKEIAPGEVEPTLDATGRLTQPASRMCPPGTTILKVFDDSGSSLLILGEPGAGKTMALLTLASGLLDRAEADSAQPVPVIFNLSSWRQGRHDLFSWLVQEFGRQYQISRRLAASWLMRNRLLLLLDGLDEVTSASRYACLAAINEFTANTGVVGIAVCSRSEEYRALASDGKLKLSTAVRLHSLTEVKVYQYLEAAGEAGLSGLRELLNEDLVLRELSQNPLMLAVMTRAYEQLPAEALNQGDLDTPEKRRDNIFGTYVGRLMHGHVALPQHYSEGSTRTFLAWLAGRLKEHSVSVFFIEQLQPAWLDGWPSQWSYLVLSRVLGSALIAVPLMIWIAGSAHTGELIPVLKAATGAALALGLGVALVDALIAMIRRVRTFSGRLVWLAWLIARLASYGIVSQLLIIAGYLALNAALGENNRVDPILVACNA
jgi:NACHT domain-containing protein